MGAQCKKVQLSFTRDYSLIKALIHPAFGQIFYLRGSGDKGDKAIKRIPCPNRDAVQALRKRIQFAKQCDNSISTLVQIYHYDIIDSNSQQIKIWNQLQSQYFSSCSSITEPFLLVHFQYFQPEASLLTIIESRQQQIQRLSIKYGKMVTSQARKIKMWDYSQIDRLPSQQRQIVNVFYQEIEIVRMIDHIIGAIYFLHHFEVQHASVRPQHILVDQEGKYVLVDRQVFARQSNYQLAQDYLRAKNQGVDLLQEQVLHFLSPQYLPCLKNRIEQPIFNQEKADIFCVGLLALKMCLLDQKEKIFQYNPYLKNIKLNQSQLNKRLVRAQERYSDNFIDLLQKMLKKDPNERIDFARLIDELNPLLQQNLEAIKKVHSASVPQQTSIKEENEFEQTYEYGTKIENENLKNRLISMEKQFQKVMNNRTMLFSRNMGQLDLKEEENKIITKLKQIKTARSMLSDQTHRKANPQFLPNPKVRLLAEGQSRQDKRYISGKELQEIVWKEYENIKSRRNIAK